MQDDKELEIRAKDGWIIIKTYSRRWLISAIWLRMRTP